MAMSRLICPVLIAVALGSFDLPGALAGSGTTAAEGWQVLESHGGVRYLPATERHWWPARTGIEIPDGSVVATGRSGFLIIDRAGESITVHPQSRLELRGGPSGTEVQQTAGNLRYRITRTPDRRFAVETPYLSLMVKGTVFDVEVSDHGTEVDVTQGRVRVDTPRGQVAELIPGQSARIAEHAAAGLEFRVGPESPFEAAPPPGRSIAAVYTRADGDRGTAHRRRDTAHQAAARPEMADDGGAATGITQGQGRVDSARRPVTGNTPAQSVPTARSASAPHALDTASRPIGRSPQAFPGGDSGTDASGTGIEVTEGALSAGRSGEQIAEVTDGQSTTVARNADADPDSDTPRESAVAAAPPPSRSIADADARDDGKRTTDSQPGHVPEAAARSDRASSGGTGDRVVWAVLVLLLLAGAFWRWRQRQTKVGNTDRGRWPWQRPRSGASPGALSSTPSAAAVRDGTRRSTTHARL